MSDAPVRVLVITGMAHAGSTVLARVLGSYEGVLSVGEARGFWNWHAANGTCHCGKRGHACPVWGGAVAASWGSWDALEPKALLRGQPRLLRLRNVPALRLGIAPPFHHRDFRRFVAGRSRLFRGLHTATGARLVVDESKSNVYALALARVPGLDVRVVHLIRDSRGHAYHDWRTRRPCQEHRRRAAWLRTSLLWPLRHARVSLMWAGTGRAITVRYEDFCKDPDGTARRILSSCGLHPPPNPGGATFDVAGQHLIGGNRRVRDTGDRLTVRYAGDWHARLPAPIRLTTSILTSPGLLAYGYLGPRSPHRDPGKP